MSDDAIGALKVLGFYRSEGLSVCPLHEHPNPTLEVQRNSSCVRLSCRKGCTESEIRARLGLDSDDAIRELAALSPGTYDRLREVKARMLGIRVSTLDREVGKLRPKQVTAGDGGQGVEFPELEPWPKPVDGAEWLDLVCGTLRRYLALPKHAAEAIALWVLHAHALDAFTVSPRLAATSPEKRCGKTTPAYPISSAV